MEYTINDVLKKIDSLETLVRDLTDSVNKINSKFEKMIEIDNYCTTTIRNNTGAVHDDDDDYIDDQFDLFRRCCCF